MAGGAPPLAEVPGNLCTSPAVVARNGGLLQRPYQDLCRASLVLVAALLCATSAGLAQSLYKYRGPDGAWIYSDRAPPDDESVEVRELPAGTASPRVTVSHRLVDGRMQLSAMNDYYAPVELILGIDELQNAERPGAEQALRWVLAARSEAQLLSLGAIADAGAPKIVYRYTWLAGDPATEHKPVRAYRAPFAVASAFTISQAFPNTVTHARADSRHAVDIVMPIGTGVYAAREGTVFEITGTNFRGGLDPERDASAANLVRILHDDGTYAEYAHLNWNSIRVKPGDVVSRGEYIADSGNTGFTSGPHLHFAVIRNIGLRVESVPVVFEGPNGSEIAPETGIQLSAY
ncbi:MAG: M23 family metallopeptidase [Woeseia sp.]